MVVGVVLEVSKGFGVARIGELIEINDGCALLFDEQSYEIGTDKSGSSGDKNLHGLIFMRGWSDLRCLGAARLEAFCEFQSLRVPLKFLAEAQTGILHPAALFRARPGDAVPIF